MMFDEFESTGPTSAAETLSSDWNRCKIYSKFAMFGKGWTNFGCDLQSGVVGHCGAIVV